MRKNLANLRHAAFVGLVKFELKKNGLDSPPPPKKKNEKERVNKVKEKGDCVGIEKEKCVILHSGDILLFSCVIILVNTNFNVRMKSYYPRDRTSHGNIEAIITFTLL